MHATANPLHRPRPARAQCVLHGRFYFTDDQGKLESGVGTHVRLTPEYLWITSDLSLPIETIDAMQIVDGSGLPPRHFVRIRYVNPVTGDPETVCLSKLDAFGIGLHRVAPLRELVRAVEALQARSGSSTGVAEKVAPQDKQPLDRCEECGAEPAFYIGYVFLVSAVLLSWRSAARRRVHCRKHNAVHGTGYYLLTTLTGWIGIGVIAYPFVVFAAARNLAPSLGRATYVLGVLPTLGLAALVASWLL
ncbi:MAG TPA: hypothetical protein VFD82_06685 [Planctomycetota bacterium]|nr:hypothetical protein [Planctomycetota bacterium]